MIKLAFNKEEPNLVYAIDGVVREPINGGIVEYYTGTLKDTSTVPDTELANYKIQVMAFEQKWSFVPVDVSGTGNVNNQAKSVTPTTETQEVKPDTGYTGLSKVDVAAVTAAIDANIVAGNIKSGVTILGVEGTYVKPEDANLLPENIKAGVTIYGVEGTYTGE